MQVCTNIISFAELRRYKIWRSQNSRDMLPNKNTF